MKSTSQFLTLVALLILAVSCGSNEQPKATTTTTSQEKKLDLETSRGRKGGKQAITRFSLEDTDIKLEELEAFKFKANALLEDADAKKLMRLNQSLMAADKEAQVLDVNFSMSDEPVGNGMFVFAIESPDDKSITLEMFDEEGYNLAANNNFSIHEGNNYKALNVNTLDDGDYLFRLKDDQGKELARTVTIEHQN